MKTIAVVFISTFLLGMALAACLLNPVSPTAKEAAMSFRLVLTEHSRTSHPESQEIFKCIEDNGPYQVFKDLQDKTKLYLICKLGNNKFGLVPVVVESANLIAKTAFIPKDGTFAQVNNYLSNIAVRYTAPFTIVP